MSLAGGSNGAAVVALASGFNVQSIWVFNNATHTFQAPGFYERRGYQRSGSWDDYPRGHGDVFFHKRLR